MTHQAPTGQTPAAFAYEGEALPLTNEQRQMLRRMHDSPYPTSYTTVVRLELTGDVRPEVLRAALDELVVRHHTLRSRFVDGPEGRPVQLVDAPRPATFELIDVTDLPEPQRAEAARELADRLNREPFDVTAGRLLRTALLRTGADEWQLYLAYHHIAVDGWALRVLLEELSVLYANGLGGEPRALPEPVQSADCARRQLDDAAVRRAEENIAWWRDVLRGHTHVLDFPLDGPRTGQFIGAGATEPVRIGPEVYQALRRTAAECGATVFVAVASAVGVFLSRLTGQRDLVLSVPFFNRSAADDRAVTCLSGPLLLLVEVRAEETFKELVERTADRFFDGLEHTALPVMDLLDTLVAEDGWTTPRPPCAAVAMQTFGFEKVAELPGATARLHHESVHVALTDLVLNLTESDDGIDGFALYRSALFRPETMRRWMRELTELTAALAREPGRPLAAVAPPAPSAVPTASSSAPPSAPDRTPA
ncbi:condensation domain-containing protein [Streptomyces sp. Da 82-17]|uniref:condensation domain-containing protein n=1 Tax=Streptomyces sp. Da 82-17 TaxID=3377116 RepID=UPI0038D353AD